MKIKFNLNFVSAFSQKIETQEIFIVLFFTRKVTWIMCMHYKVFRKSCSLSHPHLTIQSSLLFDLQLVFLFGLYNLF